MRHLHRKVVDQRQHRGIERASLVHVTQRESGAKSVHEICVLGTRELFHLGHGLRFGSCDLLKLLWGKYTVSTSRDRWRVRHLPNWNNEPGMRYNSQRLSPSNLCMSSERKPSIHTSPKVRASSLQNTESARGGVSSDIIWSKWQITERTVSDSNIRREWEVSDAHFERSFSLDHVHQGSHDLLVHFWRWNFSCAIVISSWMVTPLTRANVWHVSIWGTHRTCNSSRNQWLSCAQQGEEMKCIESMRRNRALIAVHFRGSDLQRG